MNESYVSRKLRLALVSLGAVCWKTSDRFHASRPDLLLFKDGQCVAIEMKIHPNEPTALQELTLSELSAAGIMTYVIQYNIDHHIKDLCYVMDFNTKIRYVQTNGIKELAKWLLTEHI